jgi:hypothetical protein
MSTLPPDLRFLVRCAVVDACLLSVIGLWKAADLIRTRRAER